MTENQTQSGSDLIQQVETFIKRCHDLDYVFTPESREMIVQGSGGGFFEPKQLWANKVADALSLYTLNKDNQYRLKYAQAALGYINKAIAAGLVTEGPALVQKYRKAEASIAELRTKVDELTAENLFLKAKIDLMDQGRKF